ncbi:bifunctional sugar phosphate isomerase/epimerase/4-hydroxyphenylpyruvate dioxygenase family protein [Amycolatopsis palatopharyngis]|uniref:bifunctional sugar phosphate isomerase/epimerase/4-hydroxyphenylpyruvate dioxygenase family protein n=1 Tax=Amycolatopsis palatopharyngis TaxID=187982 RepID=UPI000E288744|nr:sugar phosphate isomerase/epimerase and 4-hydroxyphenylpyruvate domain-containing protein [Amycolatopsis palatopharyngis]
MRKAIATVCLSGTLEDKLKAAAGAGFAGVEIFENDLIASPSAPEQIRARCADLGLSIDLYQPFRDFEAVGQETLRRNLRRAERKFELMRRLGADTVLVCSSVSPEAVDDDDLAAEQLHTLAELAAEHGIRVAYEALAWGRFVDTWQHSWEIVRRGDHPALGLCLDSFHVLSRSSDVSGLADVPGEKLFFLQLADAPRLNMDVLQWSRHHRLFPGQGSFDLAAFVGPILAAGYRGPLSLEVFNDVYRQSAPERAAVDAMRSLIALEEQLGNSSTAPGRERIEIPAAPELSGFAFAEIAVDDDSGPRVERALAAMGFAHLGQHRSKPVQLWQQGDARVLLNSGADGATAISALAVESADPPRSASRAEALLAPAIPRTRGPAEADLSAVAAPDGTSVFFCRTGADDTKSWLSDFILTGTEHRPATALTGIDHVALAQPFDHFDEAGLFYRAVLGLEPSGDSEFAAPFGLVRSRMVGDQDRRVRIALHGTLLRRGSWSPGVPNPQHIAFETEDVFACARAMRKRGAPLLTISDNYYDDLDARLALDPEVLAAMRECHVLYDRDETGEFFHFHTEVLGSRVFFEVVQRVGDYTGHGAINAPIRMAAHREARR